MTTHKGKLPDLPPIELPDATAVRAELALVATLLRAGQLDARTCHAFAVLMNCALASLGLESEPRGSVQFIVHAPGEPFNPLEQGTVRGEPTDAPTEPLPASNDHPSERT